MPLAHVRNQLFVAVLLVLAAVALRLLVPAAPDWSAALLLLSAVAIGAIAVARREAVCTAAPSGVRRRYTRDVLVATGAYVVLLFASLLLLRHFEGPALRALLALLPVVPIAFVLRAMVRYVRGVDELQRRIELEAICIAAALVSFVYMTAGFLQTARVIDVPSGVAMLWVFPLVCGTYGIAKSIVARHYQ